MSQRILVDTHILLWAMSDPSKLSLRATLAIEGAAQIYVSAITGWEVVMLARKQRIALDRPAHNWVHDALAVLDIVALPVTLDIAMLSENLPDYSRPDPADRFIIATALSADLQLVTADEVIRAWNGVKTIW